MGCFNASSFKSFPDNFLKVICTRYSGKEGRREKGKGEGRTEKKEASI